MSAYFHLYPLQRDKRYLLIRENLLKCCLSVPTCPLRPGLTLLRHYDQKTCYGLVVNRWVGLGGAAKVVVSGFVFTTQMEMLVCCAVDGPELLA
jgi:hypothetical protein